MLLKNMKLLCASAFAAGAMALNAAVPAMSLEYFYDKDGTIIGRSVNGEKFIYSYDKKGQLLSVKSLDGKVAEAYAYDPAGNILSKTIDGKTTYFKYDKANQLVSSTDAKGKGTNYEYDAAGRLVKEGDKEYKYSYLDKIVAVTEQGSTVATFDYYVDGQVASATQGGMQETFVWDGLALIQRNSTNYINEPAVTGGNPILADNKVLFNDMLGTTLGAKDGKGNVSQVAMTSFGESKGSSASNDQFFTGKPYIGELGHAFLFRNYRADLGKWQTADPMGYPDGWNQLAYCNNSVTRNIDFLGGWSFYLTFTSYPSGYGFQDVFLDQYWLQVVGSIEVNASSPSATHLDYSITSTLDFSVRDLQREGALDASRSGITASANAYSDINGNTVSSTLTDGNHSASASATGEYSGFYYQFFVNATITSLPYDDNITAEMGGTVIAVCNWYFTSPFANYQDTILVPITYQIKE